MIIETQNQIKIIRDAVEKHFNVNLNQPSRVRKTTHARYIYFRLCKDFTFSTLYEIGNEVDRHHATVVEGLKQFDNIKFINDRQYLNPYHKLRNYLYDKLSIKESEDSYTTMKELINQNKILKEKCKLLEEELEKNS
tara:strand:- start:223 stop:633 length:411 start_codon:yes stop_codon:yes gene_type:complete